MPMRTRRWSSVASIGKSYEGRDIWVVTVTNTATGPDTDKPAFWVDGNIHAAELTASTAVLYYLHTLVTRLRHRTPHITHLLDTRAVYLVPAPEPRRRRAGAGRQAAPHPLVARARYPYDEEPSTA